jgi:hypothetical protein
VNKIIELFSRVRDNGRDTFERDFKNAETALRAKIAELRRIEDYMRESEAKFVPFGKRYSAELKYLESSGTFIGQFCPTLNSIMDREEKNF